MPARHVNPAIVWIVLCVAAIGAAGCPVPDDEDPRLETMAEILRLEDRRSTGDGALARFLTGDDRVLRLRAALALGRIGAPPARAGDLGPLLADADPEIRATGIFALGEMGDPNGVAMLLPQLATADARCRGLAAEALGKLSDPNAIAPLLEKLEDPDDEVAGQALVAIFRLEPGPGLDDESRRALQVYRRGGPRGARAVYFLMRSQIRHPASRAPHDAIVASGAAADPDPLVRSWAARGIGACDAADPAPLPALAADADWRVRIEAFNALRRHGGSMSWETWKSGIDDQHPAVAIAALAALEKCAAPEAKEHLEKTLSHATPRYREIALVALAGRDKQGARDRLRGLRDDPAWSVRARLAEAAAGLPDEETFAALAADPDPRVRTAAAGALGDAMDRFPTAAAMLDTLLSDADVFVRSAALEEAGGLPAAKRDGRHLARLMEGYARALSDPEEDARLSALGGLATAGGDEAREGVIAALSDPAYLVRRRAAEILRDTFSLERFVSVGEPETHLAPEDYLEAARRAGHKVTASFETASGTFRAELYAADAPLTVHNFVRLAQMGKLEDLVFHRVVPGFVIQDGDPRGDGNGGPPWHIRCEINMRRYGAGAVGMALSGKDTGGSQYFVTQTPQPHLDGGYTIFGGILEGQEVVDRMVQGTAIKRVTIIEE